MAMSYSSWAEKNGFQRIGSYTATGNAVVAAWGRGDEPTYFCVYVLVNNTMTFDFVTIINGDKGLTTSNSPDGCFYPTPPGDFKQVFPDYSIDEIWKKHKTTLEYLKSEHRVWAKSNYGSFEESFHEGIVGEMKYITSIPLWPLRILYWFFVRRIKMRGISVEMQISMGLAKPDRGY
jgi:hypothetical protein